MTARQRAAQPVSTDEAIRRRVAEVVAHLEQVAPMTDEHERQAVAILAEVEPQPATGSRGHTAPAA